MEGFVCQSSSVSLNSAPYPLSYSAATACLRPLVSQPRWSSKKGGENNLSFASFERSKNGIWPLNSTARPWDPSDQCSPLSDSWGEVESSAIIRRQDLASGNHDLAQRVKLETLSQDMAMGLILRAATGTGWTTGSGLEGPSGSLELNQNEGAGEVGHQRWPWLSKSPRRRMRVAFTCNVCGERTVRAINPHAYTDGTVFVQCAGCNIFHKLVDNLKLFHEIKGRIFPGYGAATLPEHQPYDFLGLDDLPIP
eukprot:c28311_g1_i8 orf=451-1206(-)